MMQAHITVYLTAIVKKDEKKNKPKRNFSSYHVDIVAIFLRNIGRPPWVSEKYQWNILMAFMGRHYSFSIEHSI